MAGPYQDFLTDSTLLANTVLAMMGGYSKVNARPVTDPLRQVDAEETSRKNQAISDIVQRLHSVVDVRDFLMVYASPTPVQTKAAVDLAVSAAMFRGKGLHFGEATRYVVSEAILIESPVGLDISFGPGAVLVYPSSDETLVANATYDNDFSARRSGLYIRNGLDVTIRDPRVEGDDVENRISVNVGCGISLYKCGRTQILNLRAKYGAGGWSQTGFVEDTGTVVNGFHVFASRGSCRLGNNSWMVNGIFEVPANDPRYDRTTDVDGITQLGSSHAAYWYGSSGGLCGAANITLLNIRKDGLKTSASATEKITYVWSNIIASRVGLKADGSSNGGTSLIFGADDVQDRSHLLISDYTGRDCNADINLLGCRSYKIDGVHCYMSAIPVGGAKGAFITVARYTTYSQPVEAGTIRNVSLGAKPSLGASNVAVSGIVLSDCGDNDPTYRSAIDLSDIDISWCATTGISTNRCVAPTFDNITTNGLVTAISLNGDRVPHVKSLTVRNPQSNNAQIRMTDCSFPIISTEIFGAGQIGAAGQSGKVAVGDNAGGSTSTTQNPLLGKTGKAMSTNSHPEVLLAYGSDLTADGASRLGRVSATLDPTDTNGTITLTLVDGPASNFRKGQRIRAGSSVNPLVGARSGVATVTSVDRLANPPTVTFTGTITGLTTGDYLFQAADIVDLAGVTLTYVTGAPGAGQFNSLATLITAINAIGGYTAVDYGSVFASPCVTRHLKIYLNATSTTANAFYVRSFTYRPTALVWLPNYGVSLDRCYSRGEGADKFVVWSPAYKLSTPPIATPMNDAAQAAPLNALRASLVAAVNASDGTGTAAAFKASLITQLGAVALPAAFVPMRFLPLPDSADPEVSCTMTLSGLVGTEEFSWRC